MRVRHLARGAPPVREGPRDTWGRVSSYLLPPIFLGIGALVWSLWSGMEVAFFLATWAIALVAWRALEREARVPSARGPNRMAWALGAAGALVVATRPEGALTIGVFGLAAAHLHLRFGRRQAAWILARVALPRSSCCSLSRSRTACSRASGARMARS